ncbi:hypothetical protein H9Q10_06455 [Eikenella sp. S3360]|uniref:Uncharacterized protein n=1 Tax=Eikenella glucosivorans TaxID=2766967 RepID=A0ABS0NAH7_9NEIS|nr:hypothetical protein [Eikenella glucosivorans]MBH5329309.1 hypothetical protein [Eikenella glucosivorans]
MLRKVFALTALLPALAAAEPPIRDCRTFLLDMSALGFRIGACRKNAEHPYVIQLEKRQSECAVTWADPVVRAEAREVYRTLSDELINDAITPETVDAVLAGKSIDMSKTELCSGYDNYLREMARRYLRQ